MLKAKLYDQMEKEFDKYQETLVAMRDKGQALTNDYNRMLHEQLGFVRCMSLCKKILEGK